MLKKRIVGVITVSNGLAVQSFQYTRYLPIGCPICLVENLDRWGVDEIIVMDIQRSRQRLGPNLELLNNISTSHCNTPLIYGGGICSVSDAIAVVHAGADRIILDSILHRDFNVAAAISSHLGSQALIASFPVSLRQGKSLYWFDYSEGRYISFQASALQILNDLPVSEIMLIDTDHEGLTGTFDKDLLNVFPTRLPIIAFGGLSTGRALQEIIDNQCISAVAFGNVLNYAEHSVQNIKSQLTGQYIRKSCLFSKSFSLF